jgi:hypothetical protein
MKQSVVIEVRSPNGMSEVAMDGTKEGVEEGLRRLDGAAVSLMTIGNGENELFIGGGPACFSVTLLRSDGDSVALADMPEERGEIEMVIGGQRINQPRSLLVDFPTALRAANWFLDHGEAIPDLRWERPQ